MKCELISTLKMLTLVQSLGLPVVSTSAEEAGYKRSMDEVHDGLGAYSPNFEDHPAMVLVGDGRSGEWSRFFGFPSPDRLMQQVNTLQAARTVAAGG